MPFGGKPGARNNRGIGGFQKLRSSIVEMRQRHASAPVPFSYSVQSSLRSAPRIWYKTYPRSAPPRVTTYATHMHAQVGPRRPGVASPARDNQWPTGRRARARGRTYHSPAPVHAPPAASRARSASSPPGAARRPHRGAGRQVRQPAHARAWRVCEKGAHEARGRRVGRAGGRGSETCCELAL